MGWFSEPIISNPKGGRCTRRNRWWFCKELVEMLSKDACLGFCALSIVERKPALAFVLFMEGVCYLTPV